MQDKVRAILTINALEKALNNVIVLERVLMEKDDFIEYSIARRIRKMIEALLVIQRAY